jgi:hypothetical protein
MRTTHIPILLAAVLLAGCATIPPAPVMTAAPLELRQTLPPAPHITPAPVEVGSREARRAP